MANDKHPPPVLWAERNDRIFLTINVEDCKNPIIKFEEDKIFFSGKGGIEKREYEVTIDLLKGLKPEECKHVVSARNIPMVLIKKEGGPYWGRLLKDGKKVHWLKTDFSKWKDEDDSDFDDTEDMHFENMMQKMGNSSLTDGAPPGMEEDGEEDSDDEDLPDLE